MNQKLTLLRGGAPLPEEVVAFFKAQNPKGYTARMAAVLAAYMQAHQPK